MIIGKKAEWLCSNNRAYIRTNINKTAEDHIILESISKTSGVSDGQYPHIIRCGASVQNPNMYCFFWYNNYGLYGYNPTFVRYVVNNRKSEYKIEHVGSVLTITIEGVENVFDRPQTSGEAYVLFWQPSKIDNNDWIRRFELVGKLSLTPITLTSSLPAYLSSDNLPHAAGECGMWDSVNEKFYGNANTSGAFSVENELDEYVEVDLTGIAINGKYQRVSVENSEIPKVVWNGVNTRMLMLNGKVVWKAKRKVLTPFHTTCGTSVFSTSTR